MARAVGCAALLADEEQSRSRNAVLAATNGGLEVNGRVHAARIARDILSPGLAPSRALRATKRLFEPRRTRTCTSRRLGPFPAQPSSVPPLAEKLARNHVKRILQTDVFFFAIFRTPPAAQPSTWRGACGRAAEQSSSRCKRRDRCHPGRTRGLYRVGGPRLDRGCDRSCYPRARRGPPRVASDRRLVATGSRHQTAQDADRVITTARALAFAIAHYCRRLTRAHRCNVARRPWPTGPSL